jgi:anhydro-N-acetylmuramic acid kinase
MAEAEALVTGVHAETVERFLAISTRAQSASLVSTDKLCCTSRRRSSPYRSATVRRWRGGCNCRSPMTFAPRMSRRAARTLRWFRCSTRRSRATSRTRIRSRCSISAAVANVTFVDGGNPVACDTGPGNALIDDFMRARTSARLDRDGDQAAKGRVDEAFVARVLADKFFSGPCPRSLDRNAFAFANIGLPDFSVADGAATLSALTATAVARVVAHLPAPGSSRAVVRAIRP